MPDSNHGIDPAPSPLEYTRHLLRSGWRDLLSIYYANTLIWRLLKSGALIFLGLFCWSGANLVLSYRPDWGFLYVIMAYGFALLLWGPLTHFVIVPLIIRFRRSGHGGPARLVAQHGSKINLTVFILIVIALAIIVPGVMTFEFQVPTGDGGGDVDPDLQCTRSGDIVHCHLTESAGIDHVVITSGGRTIEVIDDPPFDFNVNVNELETINGDRQFTVELRDASDNILRRYVRRVELIPGS